MIEFSTGTFTNGIEYLTFGKGKKKAVIFPPTTDLICSLAKDPIRQMKIYNILNLPDYTIYVLSYGINLLDDFSYRKIASQFKQAIEIYIGPATIVGISYGGAAAMAFAADFPNLTKKLILIVSAYSPSEGTGRKFMEDIIENAKMGRHYQVAKINDRLWNIKWMRTIIRFLTWKKRKILAATWNPLSTIRIAYTDILSTREERKKLLPLIQAPTFLFGGTKDLVFSEYMYQETVDLIPNAKFIRFEGAGHMLAIERKKKFLKKLFEVLN